MTAAELRAALDKFYGPGKSVEAIGDHLGVSSRTVERWLAGDAAVPGPVIAWVREKRELEALKARQREHVNASYARRKAREVNKSNG